MVMSRSARITLLLIIDIIFFWVELVVMWLARSHLWLTASTCSSSSFHSLYFESAFDAPGRCSDVMSLVVALYAIRVHSFRPSLLRTACTDGHPQLTAQGSPKDSRYSYGWHRAEILAALINGVFLLALCFSISLEAIERFFSIPKISNPRLIVIVGSLGLASNIFGLFLFHEHGHSHSHPTPSTPARPVHAAPEEASHRRHTPSPAGSHSSESLSGHPAATRASLVQFANNIAYTSRNGHSLDAEGVQRTALSLTDDTPANPQVDNNGNILAASAALELESAVVDYQHSHDGHSHAGSMNMRALLLHVLGDALGNVGVIAAGLVIWLTNWSFKFYFDPIISLVIATIIFSTALPLVRSTSFVLLQRAPSTISIERVRAAILSVEGVLSLHELHIWQLSESKIVASVHVLTSTEHEFMPVAVNIREVLHHHGIHSSTIQPEYHPLRTIPEEHLNNVNAGAETSCLILCPPDEKCTKENVCCPPPPADV
ncbi:cation efflux protein [Pleurotus eryngii]|uniref:Cation efflux protein n=1 Tax=Pleurotus eryngii TaxID=5323 RepID=A0A9P6DA67_PLEER|nr:cation efflux protein [Pleurotus eryngii]